MDDEMLQAAREAPTDLAESIGNPDGGKCFQCKKPITRKDQIGGCVYFVPCGHHYRGRLAKQQGKEER